MIPPSSTEDAFVFGSVRRSQGCGVFQAGCLSLLQALSVTDMDLINYRHQAEAIHIIRTHGNKANFIIVDASKIVNGEAMPFQLEPGDIVFVPANGLASWNQVMNLLLPSLNTINSILNPFVSIKYLSTGTLY